MRITRRQTQVMASYARVGSYAAVAIDLCISLQTVKNHMRDIHIRLEVPSVVASYVALGWLVVPDGQ